MNPGRTCTICFLAVVLLGVGFVVIGVFVIPVLPHFQLDVVLSPTQLADPRVRDATLAVLERANGNQWLMWTVAGVVLCLVGVTGMHASLRRQMCSRTPPPTEGTSPK